MKKLLIILPLIFLLTACSDYKEVNNLAIINSIGIDYKDNNYIITLEILDSKIDKDANKIYSYTTVGCDEDIANAIEKSADNLSLRPYYPHIKLCLISKSIAENHLKEIIDYFIRNNYFRETFSILITNDKSPNEILNHKTKSDPIPGFSIVRLIKNNNYASNVSIDKNFIEFTKEILDFGKDGLTSVIDIKNDNFLINGMAIFDDYKLITIFNNNDAKLYNLLNSKISKPLYNIKINNKNFAIVIYDAKTDFKINNNILNITGTYRAKIINNEAQLDIKNPNNLKYVNKKLEQHLNNHIYNYIKKNQEYKCDTLGLGNKYYIKTRKKDEDQWQNFKIKSNVKIVINKKGLVFKNYGNK